MKPCKEFSGGKNKDGYGQRKHKGKVVGAHRVAYCEHNNVPIESIAGVVIRHKCDNPRCIEPTHLEPGTHAQNMQDRRERRPKEAGHKITRAIAEAVRARLADGFTQKQVAAEFGISQPHVCGISRRRSWP
ncbi:endonuclease [Ralstonia phage BHDT_So9]|uniref:Endonuclease n=1 Tax=Ralstonia phage BHDT_So9 TaxID=2972464 RepID=A0A9E7QYL6_9CAUD|nr:endonuclease [Ralstonia phage BHDT_So9]UWI83532.1 endonuclease [Ralstonia phage DLDT_So2]UZT26920.1 hypothetical protein [Ralstonia phage BHDTSo81]WEM03448.1 hypothetical protein [Ralstonia phage BHDT8]